MKSAIKSAFAGLTVILLGACASATKAPAGRPSATARIQQSSAAYYGSTSSGIGTLNYRGQHHRFTITSIGAGGMGAQKLNAYAKVYNLTRLSDFQGTYQGISQGLTLIEGKMSAKLTNEKGVAIYLAGETEGLATSMGVQVYEVKLTY